MPGIKQWIPANQHACKAIESFIHLLGHISVIVLVHSPEYFVDVSFLAKELLKGQSSIRVFVKNLEEPIYLSPK